VEAGEEDAASGAADGCSGVGIGKAHSLAGELINVRGEEFFAAHVPRLKVAPFIEHQVNDVRLGFCGERGRQKERE